MLSDVLVNSCTLATHRFPTPPVDDSSLEVRTLIATEPPASLVLQAQRVVEVDFRNDPRWTEFISSHPDALIYHHPGWLSALEAEYGQKCTSLVCEDMAGRLCAVLPLFYTKACH
jgi:hypothetical protein